ncbi:Tbl1xr1 protein [Capsaspora owczarzaki ATCC 30864]|uniref:Tbl1xr1 protein n=1 Tax=Capsaspora owczarzaki (strain ATCC 30864) TaxID=595528 RepID=A0A0D2WPT4_CAPO3|nr:Tbl1xr1 protein [Capsaspora owczarzaki ATCC 30864]KJE93500.1 Tbl1xr1 protein [Capsaspora owczarzaki ATCC 30864]|eukprot:XP_004348107.1 Tbl1xr1 protein [Capsaspora owczarzaki ATCC 30864]
MSLTSEEVNFLIFRYLQESGFLHSAFTFGHESLITRSAASSLSREVAPGALITFLQKGLLYVEAETHLQEDGADVQCTEPFSLLTPHVCKSKSKAKKKAEKEKARKTKKKDDATEMDVAPDTKVEAKQQPLKLAMFKPDEITTLENTSEVTCCAFNAPQTHLAAAGGAIARLWELGALTKSVSSTVPTNQSILLDHGPNCKEVTHLSWNRAGTTLTTGGYDGVVRLWSTAGRLVKELTEHVTPIFAVKWNKDDSMLVSVSIDKSAVVWNAVTGQAIQRCLHHTAPLLDVDWRTERSFATCSVDTTIQVWEVGSAKPVHSFVGHSNEVNSVLWDPAANLLASGSDDCTAKIWSMASSSPLFDLQGHSAGIYCIRWSPTGVGSRNPHLPLLLATASNDSTIRLWEVANGQCINILTGMWKEVYTLSFSPDAMFLASGAFNGLMCVWSMKDGSAVKAYRHRDENDVVFNVSWSPNGDKIAAGFRSLAAVVFDVKPGSLDALPTAP